MSSLGVGAVCRPIDSHLIRLSPSAQLTTPMTTDAMCFGAEGGDREGKEAKHRKNSFVVLLFLPTSLLFTYSALPVRLVQAFCYILTFDTSRAACQAHVFCQMLECLR